MKKEEIKSYFKGLPDEELENLLRELEQVKDEHFLPKCRQMRIHLLNNEPGLSFYIRKKARSKC